MTLSLLRAGRHGRRFLEDGRVYLTWHEHDHDLGNIRGRRELIKVHERARPQARAESPLKQARTMIDMHTIRQNWLCR